jgi:hypothetical protein
LLFAKTFQDCRAPWNQRGLIRKPLHKISVTLLHCFRGELAMVLGESNLCIAASCSSVMIWFRAEGDERGLY